MRPATIILIVLFICCYLAATVDARGAPRGPFPDAGLERGVPRNSQQWDKRLRAQSERSGPSRSRQLRVELLVEGDPPFEPNKPIQFAVLAEPWGQDLEYRYSFGDGPPTGWLGDSRFPHSYANPGTYRVYVEVRSKQGVLATTADLWRSDTVRVQVAKEEAPISVNLETPDSPPFRVGQSLRFTARAGGAGLRLEYQFFFGDGRSSAWTRDDTARHAYAAAGTYRAVVFVREQPSEEQGAPSVAGSGRALLRVVIEPESIKDGRKTVRLRAYPIEAQAGEAVRLEAHMEPETEDLEFVFEFGDGEQSERQSEGAMFHRYKNPGTYSALVRVYREDRVLTESQPVNITALPGITHRLLLETNNTNPGTTDLVRFTWHVEPPVTGVLYHVDFGDSYSGWVAEGRAEHAYRQSGEYRVLLRARIGGRDVQSNEIVVTVKEKIRAWLLMVLAATVGTAGAIVLVWRIIARAGGRKRRTAVKAGAADTLVVVHPHKDLGTYGLEFSTPVSASLEVRLQPFPDRGKQVMKPGMTTRRTNLHSSGDRGGS